MNNSFFWIGMIALLFLAMFVCLELGRYYYLKQVNANAKKKPPAVRVIEGALFGLMALLVAFTFASANVKLDARRLLMVDEANAISTAYSRLELLPTQIRSELKHEFKEYLDSRLAIYHNMMNYIAEDEYIALSNQIQNKIWLKSVTACKAQNNSSACMLILPSINTMFDLAFKRIAYTQLHPPIIVFILLVLVAFISAFLSGYSIARSKRRSIFHIICYSVIMVIALYVIIDMEFPRYGFIRENAFDSIFIDLRNSMIEK